MDKNDWYQCGAKIGDLVQSAIDSKDFKTLNESINRTIDQTLGNIAGKNPTFREKGTAYDTAKREAGLGDLVGDFFTRGGFSVEKNINVEEKDNKTRGSNKGLASMIIGFAGTAFFGFNALLMLLGGAITGIGEIVFPAIFFLVLGGVFTLLGLRGRKYRKLAKQLRQFSKIMGDRDVISVEELAHGTGQSVEEVQSQLREIIQEGMFTTEAYIDPQGTTLMTSHDAYQQYQDTMKAYRTRQAEEERQRTQAQQRSSASEEELAKYSEETRKVLLEGRDFIAHIHACNDALPEKEISDKLDRLEQVVTRIFDQVAAKPESAPDLHKMMSYYLPITRKLIDAYVDMQGQIQGENVRKTREEIEKSLDTINLAFESFLDSFYQDTAWDISSDITTIKTMMARDGLTGRGDFDRIRHVANDVGGQEKAPAQTQMAAQAGAAVQTGGAAAAQSAAGAAAGGAAAAMKE